MSTKIIMKDIAADLGISIPTVHRALNGTGRVSKQTREKIVSRAVELGYKPPPLSRKPVSQYRIAVICPDDAFYTKILHGARVAAEEYGTERILVDFLVSPDYKPEQHVDYLRQVLDSNVYDGVAVCPVHSMLMSPLIDALVDKGVPVVTFNVDVQCKRLSYVGEDPLISGAYAAQLCSSILPEGAKIVLLQSLSVTENLRLRIQGFETYVENNPRLTVTGVCEFFEKIESAREIIRQLLLTAPVDAIYATSMFGTIGAAQVLAELDPKTRPLLIGHDFNDDIKDFIEQSVLYGTLFQSPSRQGYGAVNMLYKILDSPMPIRDSYPCTHLPIRLILKSNLYQNQECDLF